MSGVAPEHESLTQAFRSFERAAANLQRRHTALRDKVEQLESQLCDANRRLEAVFDALDGGIAVVAAGGALLRTNKAFGAMGLFDAAGRLSDPALLSLLGKEAGGTARLTRRTAAGSRHLAATLVPVGDADGSHVLSVQDITDIKREEAEDGRQRRLAALGRMAAELAHEVRNPLGSIRLFAGLLFDDLERRESQRAMAEQILAATAGLESTVSNLLAFAAPSRGRPRPIDAAEVAREACALLAPACSVRGVTLEGPDEAALCPLAADPEGLRQILLNLLGNALAATAEGGTIRVVAERDGTLARLCVEDDGRGIPAEELPQVFDPFFSRTEGGTGLGLSIVHGIVERHAGRIALDSRPGTGTRALVELPAEAAHA